ncbi:MAG: HAD-IIA family hydrolase [Chloroflexi bacterium]|nr:HAD-IIA family hydrolase [Chloroflexota bacterium]
MILPQRNMPVTPRCLLLDMDGVLWHGDSPIGNIGHILDTLNRKGIAYGFVTNNSTRTDQQISEKFGHLGILVEPSLIFTSSKIMGVVLKERYPPGGNVYIIGERGLQEPLAACGFFHAEEDPLAVVVGLDRGFDYQRLKDAARFIRAGSAFYATNPDPTLPSPDGLVPGAGSLIAAIEAASNQKAMVVGKPQPLLFEVAMREMNLQPFECLVVGDRLDTDIAGGQAAGCRTALVLSGATTAAMAAQWKHPPDIVAEDLSNLVERL